MHSILIFIYLLIAGIASGLLSSMAGLASLISYPVLLSLGLPPVNANVTNTASLVFTGIGSGISSVTELKSHKEDTIRVSILSIAGAVGGSLLLTLAPASTFQRVVPLFIFMAGCLMLFSLRQDSKPFLFAKKQSQSLLKSFLANSAILLVGIYGGYFGAAAGIMLLSILSITLTAPLPVSNAIKNFTSLITNLIAIFIYTLTIKVYWLMVIPMGIGMFIGGYIGPIIVRRVPTRPLRICISVAAFCLAGYLFYGAYFK
ncbi:permease [Paucilactobacillus hokkaidonensis JCM 18461]|uniref:Probable membrane transporter protein n=1 Tax=Paucilactobacillus hokkaidonensis JCM 18461 TaxID=1291742 RepID=A0A0A1GUU6_9LACO|nr:sulfite exporter TauE/SafE family protein [Paucilactobacillus hokkaidonensis]BAP85760.1 permease [Paucilactobacillus hokkaidonensis JCM 18461]